MTFPVLGSKTGVEYAPIQTPDNENSHPCRTYFPTEQPRFKNEGSMHSLLLAIVPRCISHDLVFRSSELAIHPEKFEIAQELAVLLKSNWERANWDTANIPEDGGERGSDRKNRAVSGEEMLKGFERAVSRRASCLAFFVRGRFLSFALRGYFV